jgi:hypothetical protein
MKIVRCGTLAAIFAMQAHNARAATLEINAGLGLAIKSDNSYSGTAEVGLGINSWKTAVQVFGYSESGTTETNILAGEIYSFHLNTKKTLEGGIGIGAIYTRTTADGTIGNMTNIAWPIRLDWQFAKFGKFTANAKWTTWLFFPYYVPVVALLSHDRISTVGISAGFEL